MHSRVTRCLTVGGAAVAALAVAMTSATAAAPTFTIKAGTAKTGTAVAITGTSQGASPQIHFTDTTTNTPLTCTSSTVPGSTKVGSGQSGTGIGNLNGAASKFNGCAGPFGLTFTVTGIGAWKLNALKTVGATTAGSITAIRANVSDPGVCSFTVTGTVAGNYSNTTHNLTLPGTVSALTISGVPSGQCFGVVNNGDKAAFKGVYNLKANVAAYNPVTITSP